VVEATEPMVCARMVPVARSMVGVVKAQNIATRIHCTPPKVSLNHHKHKIRERTGQVGGKNLGRSRHQVAMSSSLDMSRSIEAAKVKLYVDPLPRRD
jgi:hypothetical protein